MGTRLLPDYINLKQRALMEPVRFRFAETQHDSLAQSPGRYTWHIDEEGKMYRVIGKKELNMQYNKQVNATSECITTSVPVNLKLSTFSENDLPAGEYTINLECYSLSGRKPSLDIFSSEDKPLEYSIQSKGQHLHIQFKHHIKSSPCYIKIQPKENIKLCSLTIL